jgi:integrase
LEQWSATWFDSIDVAPATEAQYQSLAHNHIIPRWGTIALADISGIAVRTWIKQLHADGYAAATTSTILNIMSTMLADAVEERLIQANPIHPWRRRGRRTHGCHKEQLWATPQQVNDIAIQARAIGGDWAALLLITAAYTGARWGELAGLRRVNTRLDDGCIVIDPHTGALHEINGHLELGPPKTAQSARTIPLPEFLTALLSQHLHAHEHPHVFVTARGDLLRRSNFDRRIMRPACDGNISQPQPRIGTQPILPGLTFQGLRHSHKTWMISDGIPEVAQAHRLGHKLPNKIQDVYSHVAPDVEHRLLVNLQQRWEASPTRCYIA